MAHELFRLVSKITNTPQLIEIETFNSIFEYLENRNSPEFSILPKDRTISSSDVNYNPDTKIGMIDISGPLTYLEYEPICGAAPTSYQSIQSQFDALVEGGAKTVVLSVDSPGGMAYGMMELGKHLRNTADANGINLISYTDGLSASAGYGLASSAHYMIINPESELGSVGVVVKLRNINEAMKKAGVKDTYVYAGDSKIPYDEDGEFSKSFLEDIQSKVDVLYNNFVEFVSSMRQISPEAVRNTQAKVFTSEQAVELGLADEIMTRDEFFNYLADVVQRNDNNMLKTKLFNKKQTVDLSTQEIENMATLEALQASIATLTQEFADFKTVSAEAITAKDVELTSLQTQLKDVTDKLEKADATLATAEAVKQEQKLTARKSDLSKVLNAEKLEEAFTVLANVDDVVFSIALSGYQAAMNAEKDSPAFKELGVGGQGADDAEKLSGLQALANKKYAKKA